MTKKSMNSDNISSNSTQTGDFHSSRRAPFGSKWQRSQLPMFLADTDFGPPPVLIRDFQQLIQKHNFGYTLHALDMDDSLRELICHHHRKNHRWNFTPDDIIFSPSHAIHTPQLLESITPVNAAILSFTPEYDAYKNILNHCSRTHVESRLLELSENQSLKYDFDFNDIENKLKHQGVKTILMSSPHNPTGTVFKKNSLVQLVKLCQRYGCFIVSSEVWSGLLLAKNKFHALASVCPQAQNQVITLTGTSKTYGTSGLNFGYIIVSNLHLKENILNLWSTLAYDKIQKFNIFGRQSMYTLLESGEPWRQEFIAHIKRNQNKLHDFLVDTDIRFTKPQAGYYTWMDFSAYSTVDPCFELENETGLCLKRGDLFDLSHGLNFGRICYACPDSTISRAIDSLHDWLQHHKSISKAA